METELIGGDYAEFLREMKERIRSAQIQAALNVNRELVLLYWQIGREILTRQQTGGWGAKIIERLSRDLRAAFPEIRLVSHELALYAGFCPRLSRRSNCPTACWTNSLGAQRPHLRCSG